MLCFRPVLLILGVSLLALAAGRVQARDYYISVSGGNNAWTAGVNDPWFDFTNVATTVFQPGDRILLKRGDVWWYSTLRVVNCRGTAAAPIIIDAYGSGSKPQIRNTWKYDGKCVILEKPHYVTVRNLDLREAKVGIYVRYDNTSQPIRYGNKNVAIESCDFSYMDDPDWSPANHNNEVAYSAGIWIGGNVSIFDVDGNGTIDDQQNLLDGMSVTFCTFNSCAISVGCDWYFPNPYLSRITNLTIADCYAVNTAGGGPYLNCVNGFTISRFNVHGYVRWDNLTSGNTMGMLKNVTNGTIDNCEFAYAKRGNNCPDGVGFDFEGGVTNTVMSNCVIHDNDGAAILAMRGSGSLSDNTNVQIQNCTFYNNAQNPKSGQNYEMIANSPAGTGSITNTGLYKKSSTSGWFSSNWGGYTKTNVRQNSWTTQGSRPDAWDWGAGNSTSQLSWSGYNHWNLLGVDPDTDGAGADLGFLFGQSSGNDMFGYSPATWINTRAKSRIRVRLAGWGGANPLYLQAFFVTETDGTWNGTKSSPLIAYPSSVAMGLYDIDMSQVAAWKGIVTQLRFDPTIVSGTSLNVDYLNVIP